MPDSPVRMMTAALKRVLVPEIRELGFSGRFPDFKRHGDDLIEFLSIQYDKVGSSFILEAGVHSSGDYVAPWGGVVKEQDISIEYVDMALRARLAQPSGRWFAFGRLGDEVSPYSDLARKVNDLIPELVAWFTDGRCGPNVDPMVSNKSLNSDADKTGAG